ncbi:mechanosensitive ion channel protein [Thalassotalea loyana]|uniref:Small-conductance mechanosensitive channel n=2 Tax=Thalassotalea loyana TaxID=280483 RepID=A0ABQ6H903_9GAMM|nr:mechanosensitive ion channel protein [Thalassotalea loyana]
MDLSHTNSLFIYTIWKEQKQVNLKMDFKTEEIEQYAQLVTEMGIQFGTKLLTAIIVWFIGAWIIKKVVKLLDVAMTKKKVEVTLHQFLLSIFNITLKAILVIIFASMVGIETASLIAMLGAAGLAVGLALQGSLSNFAGGILILFFKPFKAGDVIDAQGYVGTVDEIQIFNTIIRTLDNQRVIIPNGLLSNGCVKNVFVEPTRRVDMTFGISYDDDLTKAKAILRDICDNDERILKDPIADIFISAHADSSINILVRPWVASEHYWEVHFDVIEKVKLAFDEQGITIPYPQRDVHIYQQNTSN